MRRIDEQFLETPFYSVRQMTWHLRAEGANEKALFQYHSFALACAQNDIDHRLTKPYHPWTNGQVERMNRTIKDATVRRHDNKSHYQLREHLKTLINANKFAKRLKTLRGLTPFEAIAATWTSEP